MGFSAQWLRDWTGNAGGCLHSQGSSGGGHRRSGRGGLPARFAGYLEPMRGDTGFSDQDAQSDFSRARRRQVLSRLSARLRREPDDVGLILPFDEVVAALGQGRREAARPAGDPASTRSSARWTARATSTAASGPPRAGSASAGSGSPRRCAAGEAMPPISVYRIGDLHFVEDGHHRVSVARAAGPRHDRRLRHRDRHQGRGREDIQIRDLALKSHERLFFERVPLPPRGARADQAQEQVLVRRDGRGGRGVGVPADAGAARVPHPRARSPEIWFRRGVRARGRDAAARPT